MVIWEKASVFYSVFLTLLQCKALQACTEIKVTGAEMYFSQQTKAAPHDYYQYHRWQDCAEECKRDFMYEKRDACSWKYEPLLHEYKCTHVVNVVHQMISSSATESGVTCSVTTSQGCTERVKQDTDLILNIISRTMNGIESWEECSRLCDTIESSLPTCVWKYTNGAHLEHAMRNRCTVMKQKPQNIGSSKTTNVVSGISCPGVDECSSTTIPYCHSNATCYSIDRSNEEYTGKRYKCMCNQGFNGTGFNCTARMVSIKSSYKIIGIEIRGPYHKEHTNLNHRLSLVVTRALGKSVYHSLIEKYPHLMAVKVTKLTKMRDSLAVTMSLGFDTKSFIYQDRVIHLLSIALEDGRLSHGVRGRELKMEKEDVCQAFATPCGVGQVCKAVNGGHICVCRSNYEVQNGKCVKKRSLTLQIGAPVVVVLLLVVVVVVLVRMLRWKSKSNDHLQTIKLTEPQCNE